MNKNIIKSEKYNEDTGANGQTQSGIYYIDDLTKPNPKTFN